MYNIITLNPIMGETPPNPSRLANGQGFRPPPPPNPSRLANGQGLGAPQPFHCLSMDKGCPPPSPPQPFTTCLWTRVGGPPNPSRFANAQGLGAPQPFTTCKWTRVGVPRSSPHYQHYGWTKVGPLQPFAIWGGSPNRLYRFQQYVSKPTMSKGTRSPSTE